MMYKSLSSYVLLIVLGSAYALNACAPEKSAELTVSEISAGITDGFNAVEEAMAAIKDAPELDSTPAPKAAGADGKSDGPELEGSIRRTAARSLLERLSSPLGCWLSLADDGIVLGTLTNMLTLFTGVSDPYRYNGYATDFYRGYYKGILGFCRSYLYEGPLYDSQFRYGSANCAAGTGFRAGWLKAPWIGISHCEDLVSNFLYSATALTGGKNPIIRTGNAAYGMELGNSAQLTNVPQSHWRVSKSAKLNNSILSNVDIKVPWFKKAQYSAVPSVNPEHPGTCKLEMRIFKENPAEKGLKPIIMYHGGFHMNRAEDSMTMESMVARFTSTKHIVFMPFYRLAGDTDGNTECNMASIIEQQADTIAAVQFILDHGAELGSIAVNTKPDPGNYEHKIKLFGFSAGGMLAYYTAYQSPMKDYISKVGTISGPTSIKYAFEHRDSAPVLVEGNPNSVTYGNLDGKPMIVNLFNGIFQWEILKDPIDNVYVYDDTAPLLNEWDFHVTALEELRPDLNDPPSTNAKELYMVVGMNDAFGLYWMNTQMCLSMAEVKTIDFLTPEPPTVNPENGVQYGYDKYYCGAPTTLGASKRTSKVTITRVTNAVHSLHIGWCADYSPMDYNIFSWEVSSPVRDCKVEDIQSNRAAVLELVEWFNQPHFSASTGIP